MIQFFSARGVLHPGRGPRSQPDSVAHNEAHDILTDLSGRHSFPAEGKVELLVQESANANRD